MSRAPDRGRLVWSWPLLVVGCLIVVLSGLCTGNAIIDAFTRQQMDLPRSTVVAGALIIGGIPFAIGVAMAVSAMWRRRQDFDDV